MRAPNADFPARNEQGHRPRGVSGKRLPWFKFYPADHLTDPNLRSCTLAAQGLWMRLICLMVQNERHGVLVMAGRPMTSGDIAIAVGYPRRTVEPLIRELREREVCSVDAQGCLYSRRLVRDWERSEADRTNGTRGGNPAITPADLNGSFNKPGAPHVGADESTLIDVPLAAQPRSNEGPLAVEWTSSDGRFGVELGSNSTAKTSENSMLLEKWLNPSVANRVKAETETETEIKEERISAVGIGADARDAPATTGEVIRLRARQADGKDVGRPVQPILAMPPVPLQSPDTGRSIARPRRNRGERVPATGSEGMQADESRALASWNRLAVATGMVQGTMNALMRRRIRTILAIGGGLPAWDAALAAAEVAPHWNGTGNSDWRPTVGSFCKPDLFAKLLNGAYAPRERRAAERPMSARDRANIDAMERIMDRVSGDFE